MKFINLTMHPLTLLRTPTDPNPITLPKPADPAAVVRATEVILGTEDLGDGFALTRKDFTAPTPMPAPAQPGELFVVSALALNAIAQHHPERLREFASPGNLLRDQQGNPVGAVGLSGPKLP